MNKEAAKGYFCLLMGGVFWGTAGVFMTLLTARGLGPLQIAFFNLGSAALFVGIFGLITVGPKAFKISKIALLRLMVTGLFSETLYDLCYINAVDMIGVGLSAVLLYTSPIFVCILARLIFKEKITWKMALAIAMNVIGCLLAVTGGNITGASLNLTGVLLGISAGFLYGLVTILGKFNAGIAHPTVITFYNFLCGFIFMLPIARPWTFPEGTFTAGNILLGLACGSIGAGVPYIFYMTGMAKPVEAAKAQVFASTEPIVAAILGALLFGEDFGAVTFIGIIIIMASVLLMNSQPDEHLPDKNTKNKKQPEQRLEKHPDENKPEA